MKKILVICTGNSCRSQMAEGWLKHFSSDLEVFSAGTHPEPVNKYAIKVMSSSGIDISKHTSNNIEEYRDIDFDLVLTVCNNAKERCPYFETSTKKLHHSFKDPANAKGTDKEKLKVYSKVRDEIRDYVRNLLNTINI